MNADRVGLGLAALGRPAYITSGRSSDLGTGRSVDDLRERTHAVLDAAYAAGVRYLDAARSYGRAEEFLAGWLAAHPEIDDVEVGSKWGYRYVGEWRLDADVHERKEHSVRAFHEQRAATAATLGDRLGIYYVHSVTPESAALTDPALHRALADLRRTGVRVGASTSGPHQAEVVRRVLDITVDGTPLFTAVQCTWNLLEPSVGPALADAAAAGTLVVVKEAVANGRLAPGGGDAAPAVKAVTAAAEQLGVPVDQLAIAAALAQPWAWRVLSGAVTVEQVRSNVAAARHQLPVDVLQDLLADAEDADDYWAARARRTWA
ncbi:aldo/keto reductase [Pseudonocardia sp. CA-107938]|uniref:aldo/keto reductase n=1 Tax=Pseudonocardia sp. CA-107938 TaxID=3240021 RepID=UPI003D920CB3